MTKTTITVKRPNGQIEIVDMSDKWRFGITDQQFKMVRKATREGGCGECLSYKCERIDDRPPAEIAHDEQLAQQAKKARRYDAINNEGGEGYNPYRRPDTSCTDDRTPWQQGDDQAE